jgi:ABC-type sugar transport system substrate-binding protein
MSWRSLRVELFLALGVAVLLTMTGCPSETPDTESGETPAVGTPQPEDLIPGAKPKGKISVAMIPKVKGIDYFNATERGAREAAKELGVDLTYDGPIKSRVEDQIQLIDSFITRKVDVIAVSPNDPNAIAPVLRRARERGVHVITWDADADPEASDREFFVDQASPESVGRTLVDVMAREAGEDAKTVIITGTLTAANQNEWMKWMRKQIEEKHPKMEILDVKPSEEDPQRARQVAEDVLRGYGELEGVFAITSVAFPGAAAALEKSGRVGEVALTGLSSPKTMKRWVESGTVKTVVLWNPVDLGYLTICAAKALTEGSLKPGASEIEAGRLGTKAVEADRVVLGDPMLFTRDNINDFDF